MIVIFATILIYKVKIILVRLVKFGKIYLVNIIIYLVNINISN